MRETAIMPCNNGVGDTRILTSTATPARLHQLDSIFAIFGAVSGGKPLYFRVWQIENRL
jgi:hypothetical protein